jgi:hypothetical protein
LTQDPRTPPGGLGFTLFFPTPATEGGVSAPPFSSSQRAKSICQKASHESDYVWDQVCGWCGKRVVGKLAHEIGDVFWHLRCVDREVSRREVEL